MGWKTREERMAMIKSLFIFGLLTLIFSQIPTVSPSGNRPGLSLRATFDLYVKSVQGSNLDGLFSTVTEKETFFFLTSGGRLIATRSGYYKFHEEWFQEKDWEMPVDHIEVHEGHDIGYATAQYHYKGRTPAGGRYLLDSWFTLIFRKEGRMWKVVADVCTPISRTFQDSDSDLPILAEQKFLLDTLKNRRTVRKFKPTPVPQDHLMKILDAARFAPTAGNQQPWIFLVIRDRARLDSLKEAALSWALEAAAKRRPFSSEELASLRATLARTLMDVLSAPVYVAVLTDSKSKYPDCNVYDGSLAAGMLMIAARALGYGTGFFTSYFPEARMKEFFRIPDRYNLICFTPIGIPEAWPQTPAKKALADIVVFDKFK
jgi:nitroreductase/ketosteroid isomerase-like protein